MIRHTLTIIDGTDIIAAILVGVAAGTILVIGATIFLTQHQLARVCAALYKLIH